MPIQGRQVKQVRYMEVLLQYYRQSPDEFGPKFRCKSKIKSWLFKKFRIGWLVIFTNKWRSWKYFIHIIVTIHLVVHNLKNIVVLYLVCWENIVKSACFTTFYYYIVRARCWCMWMDTVAYSEQWTPKKSRWIMAADCKSRLSFIHLDQPQPTCNEIIAQWPRYQCYLR